MLFVFRGTSGWPAVSKDFAVSARSDPEAGHNQIVRRVLAVAILVVFASLNAFDAICCPDGCTQSTSQQQSDHSGDGSCLLCLGSIVSAAVPVLTPSGHLTNRTGHPPLRSHVDAFANPPDHPPRA
jgi:hypothetical protein